MSTIEDFKNAPVWATATSADGIRIMKMDDDKWGWGSRIVPYLSDEEMANEGFTLEPPVPTSAREALDLAWDLAHPVKEGQVLPEGSQYLERSSSGVKEYTVWRGVDIVPGLVPIVRTLEPLPEPEPDWLDAPAVIAHVDAPNVQPTSVFTPTGTHPDRWGRFDSEWTFHWNELRNVIPLYPRGQDD